LFAVHTETNDPFLDPAHFGRPFEAYLSKPKLEGKVKPKKKGQKKKMPTDMGLFKAQKRNYQSISIRRFRAESTRAVLLDSSTIHIAHPHG
jgi:hypothetical protein